MSYIGNTPFTAAFLTDTFSGDGSDTTFTLSAAPANTSSIIVAVSGVLQDPSTYSVSGTTLTFSAAPPSGTDNISVRFLGIPASGVTTTAYRTVTEFTATAGQTSFSVPSYTAGYVDVYRNGVMLGTADFTATSGTTVVLASGATAGDLIRVESFYVSSVLNAIPAVAGAVNNSYINSMDSAKLTGAIDVNASASADTLTINSSSNVGVGTSGQPFKFHVYRGSMGSYPTWETTVGRNICLFETNESEGFVAIAAPASGYSQLSFADPDSKAAGAVAYSHASDYMRFTTVATERMRIDNNGNVLLGKTSTSSSVEGIRFLGASGYAEFTRAGSGNNIIYLNRQDADGDLMRFAQADTQEGSISVSGTTVSYNGGHLSRWAQTTGTKDETLVKGTVLSNLDEMNVYTDADGNPVDNEQLNKVKVSDVEGDANVAGVFVNWSYDEAHSVDEINMAMTGDMIIRIAQGVTVQRGDLLMSAGDGTAKPQGDDIVRSKTIAKVTSTHVTCTYEDGSYCVPCVLMAC